MGNVFDSIHNISTSNMRIFALSIDFVASVILTIHVLFIHQKFQIDNENGEHIVILNDREDVERVFLIIAVFIYLFSFVILLWAEIKDKNMVDHRWDRLEKHLGIELNMVDDVPVKK